MHSKLPPSHEDAYPNRTYLILHLDRLLPQWQIRRGWWFRRTHLAMGYHRLGVLSDAFQRNIWERQGPELELGWEVHRGRK